MCRDYNIYTCLYRWLRRFPVSLTDQANQRRDLATQGCTGPIRPANVLNAIHSAHRAA